MLRVSICIGLECLWKYLYVYVVGEEMGVCQNATAELGRICMYVLVKLFVEFSDPKLYEGNPLSSGWFLL